MTNTRKPRALVVDDDQGVRQSLKRELEWAGYQVQDTDNPLIGLDYLMLYHIELLITDQRMPGLNGHELLRRAKPHAPETTKIMISGHSDFDELTQALNQGDLHGFLGKPWTPEELTQLIDAANDRLSLQRNIRKTGALYKY